MLLKPYYEVLTATGADAALQLLQEETVGAVITDLRMPGASGIALLREIKTNWPQIEVIILTGYGQLDSAMAAIDLGAFAYVEKPFDNGEMLAKVRACIARREETLQHLALEELAFKASRFETLGRLVTGTMHDLGTPLSVINTHIDKLMMQSLEADVAVRLRSIQSQVSYCAEIVRTTMNFLRHAPSRRAAFSLNSVVRTCLEVAGPIMAKEGVKIELNLETGLGPIEGELVLVRQAVLNLITNAAQAMNHQEGPRNIYIRTWTHGGEVCLSVEDTGPGIPGTQRERIFDALFTTKSEGGTGLGLAVVKHVMAHHHGRITLENPEAGGARFVMHFPYQRPDSSLHEEDDNR
jgi:signal transduction histidine kinase